VNVEYVVFVHCKEPEIRIFFEDHYIGLWEGEVEIRDYGHWDRAKMLAEHVRCGWDQY
jgi:hypothetical protein